MKLRMYSIRDGAVGAFMRPWFARSDGEARRAFMDQVNSPETALGQHPEDYCLFFLGEVEELTGEVEVPPQPESLGLATSYLREGVTPLAVAR